jgi:choline dehydrogenase-like flavoprotein
MDQAYRTVYRRIPVAGPSDDDLSPYLSGVHPSQAPVRLSAADERLMGSYRRRRQSLARLGVRLGAARLAVVTDPQRADACDYCERCLWGCPRGSIYNPAASTLVACQAHKGYRYVPGRLVLALLPVEGRIGAVRFLDTASQRVREEICDAVFLAAGALQTGAVFLRTLRAARVDVSLETDGLLDTTVVKVPYVALRGIGRPAEERSFQFNRLIVGVVRDSKQWPRYLHGEVMHLTSLLYHPLIERMPFDSRLSMKLFFALRSALGAVSLFFPDRIAPGNRQVLLGRGIDQDPVELRYRDTDDKEDHIRRSIAIVRAALLRLGCVPKGIARSPAGGGIHYAGTVPMGAGPKRCDASGRSNLFPNLYISDGAAFPSLPSKSITLSLAAHATRVALTARL